TSFPGVLVVDYNGSQAFALVRLSPPVVLRAAEKAITVRQDEFRILATHATREDQPTPSTNHDVRPVHSRNRRTSVRRHRERRRFSPEWIPDRMVLRARPPCGKLAGQPRCDRTLRC